MYFHQSILLGKIRIISHNIRPTVNYCGKIHALNGMMLIKNGQMKLPNLKNKIYSVLEILELDLY
jgi:uncharacterized membrane protein YcaP (DUF421 family)